MGTNNLQINISDSPDQAPTYMEPEHIAAEIVSAHIVARGTVGGNPTVDIVMQDTRGQKYVAMVTGAIIQSLAGAVEAVRQRSAGQD